MLAGMALKRRWQSVPPKLDATPNMVFGANVQVVWEKYARYWDVEPRYVPAEGDVFHLTPDRMLEFIDENTIGVVAILGRPTTAATSRSARSPPPSTRSPTAAASTCRSTSTRHPLRGAVHPVGHAGVGLPPLRGEHLRLGAQVRASPTPGVGWVPLARRGQRPGRADLPRELPGRRHADVRHQLLAPGHPGDRPVLQLRPLGHGGYRRIQQTARTSPCTSPTRSRPRARSCLITRGNDLPPCSYDQRRRQLHGLRAVSKPCASTAGRSRLHDALRPPGPRHLPDRGAGTGWAWTSPTCSSPTCARCRSLRGRALAGRPPGRLAGFSHA